MRQLIKKEKFLETSKRLLSVYLIYAFVTGVMIFAYYGNSEILYIPQDKEKSFLGDKLGPDRVVLIEDGKQGGIARINLFESAEKTLDICCFTVHRGKSSKIFFGKVLEAADRGVQVRILLDGIFHNLRGSYKDILYSLESHPNIEFKLYEPFNLIKPWTWNNRLHDKHIIVDDRMVLTGGRNIGDRYFIDNDNKSMVRDRDVLIINTDLGQSKKSSIYEIKSYFDWIWNCQYSKKPKIHLSEYRKVKGENKKEELEEYIQDMKKTYPHIFNTHINWLKKSVSTNKVTFIHNPIGRFNGQPKILWELSQFIKDAKESVVIQSPYVVPNREMIEYIPPSYTEGKEITVLTNSLNTTPNFFGMAGYIRRKDDVESFADYLYEYQGKGSIHGKSCIIDNRISLVGSFNIDPRSAFLNTESMVVIDSEEFCEILNNNIDRIIDQSELVNKDHVSTEKENQGDKSTPLIKRIIIKGLSKIAFLFEHLI